MIPTNYPVATHQLTAATYDSFQPNLTESDQAVGYISRTGKLVIPTKSIEQLERVVDWGSGRMKVGVDAEKTKIDTLYLVPTQNLKAEAFTVIQAAKGYTIEVGRILLKEGIMYKTIKYTFTIEPVLFEQGRGAYRLRLQEPIPKLFYIWKAFKGLQQR